MKHRKLVAGKALATRALLLTRKEKRLSTGDYGGYGSAVQEHKDSVAKRCGAIKSVLHTGMIYTPILQSENEEESY